MDIERPNSDFQIPSFARPKTYSIDTTRETFAVYQELNQIAEELEECRSRNY